jgi:acetyl esterase
MALKPHAAAFLKDLEMAPKKPLTESSIEEWRAGFQILTRAFGTPFTPCHHVEDFFIDRKAENLPPLPIRFYKPLEKIDRVFLYVHGGGWCKGSIDIYDTFVRQMANTLNIAVLSVEYRLAPENPFPAASKDVFDAYCWTKDVFIKEHHIEKLYFGGDSGGGSLSAGVTCKCIDEEKKLPDTYIGIYPSLDLSCSFPSYEEYNTGYLLTTEAVKLYVEKYLSDQNDQHNFLASPLRYKHLEKFPKTIILTAEYDPLFSEQEEFVKALKGHNIDVQQNIVKGVIHNFMLMNRIFPEVQESLQWLKEKLA